MAPIFFFFFSLLDIEFVRCPVSYPKENFIKIKSTPFKLESFDFVLTHFDTVP